MVATLSMVRFKELKLCPGAGGELLWETEGERKKRREEKRRMEGSGGLEMHGEESVRGRKERT